MTSQFLTFQSPATTEFVERRSKFISFAYPIISEDEVKDALKKVKELHPKARHICYAYRLGAAKDIYKINDAGEPSGTAGLPIFNQIRSADVTNILVVVVRYFGGIKLGAAGLTAAYKEAAQQVISAAEIIADVEKEFCRLQTKYETHNLLLNYLKTQDATVANQTFDEMVNLEVWVAKDKFESFIKEIRKLPYVSQLP
ncbi:MAG: YigZ family protein [Bacteroidetes bacterium]|nr:YigZ family protein [Bacteroidota bacterium]